MNEIERKKRMPKIIGNPADLRIAELRKRELEDKEWSARCGPVTVRKIGQTKDGDNS